MRDLLVDELFQALIQWQGSGPLSLTQRVRKLAAFNEFLYDIQAPNQLFATDEHARQPLVRVRRT